jgi:type II secretion system protein C
MRYIARLGRLIWVLNIVLLVVVGSLTVISVVPTRPSQSTTAATGAKGRTDGRAAPARDPAAAVDPKLILERDIFRVGQAAAAEQAQEMAGVQPGRPKVEPKPEMPLRLLGTVVDEGGASYAVIENSGSKSQDVYRVGDGIGEARVQRIEQNRVVVLNAGVLQTLDLVLTGPNVAAAKVVAETSVPEPAPVEAGRGAVLRVASATERQINTRPSAENLSKATEFLRKLKLAPHQADGKADGLAISGLGDSVLAQLSGLKDGDVVESINGHPVPNAAKAAQVLKKARSLGMARLELKRGQESKSLTFRTGSW